MKKILDINLLSMTCDNENWALKNCNFSLQSGKICAVLGESGIGKSTLFRLIAGVERPNSSTISIKNRVVSDDVFIVPPRGRSASLVFQDYVLFPHLTVNQNIGHGLEKTDKSIAIKYLLELIKMEEFADKYPAELSRFQTQRLAIAKALALQPELLLLDEPFSNLDTTLKSELRLEIGNIVRKTGTSLVFFTHHLCDAFDIADEIVFLKEGEVVHQGLVSDLSDVSRQQELMNWIVDVKYQSKLVLEKL
ncbi:MAG: ATP-binding cassette domain-containing protein [Salibacteraceae bacterium]|mgnify:CR=1 FL=1|nr:ATP-binding cassette domain-containing protein [Salibacteraceae bacterium]|tara:strand:+ start:25580 stop:26329 length:750 start_codon:yes stop_codon:yes gene_type:complete